MEFIRISKKYSLIGGIIHTFFNILLVLAVWGSIYATKLPYIGLILVTISKWRTFAVRPRYWVVNFKSNIVDLIFCLGIAVLLWSTGTEFIISQVFLALVYIIWITVIKPLSTKKAMKAQALLAVIVGLTALFSNAYSLPTSVVVLIAILIGYSSFRHVLSSEENSNIELYSLFWGMMFGEIAWFFTYWVIGYSLIGMKNFVIPQSAIIMTVLSFLAFEAIDIQHDKDKTSRDLIPPIVFSIIICVILLFFFSDLPKSV